MKRKTEYDATKLTQVATNKAVMSVYVDAFPIEQVRLRFAEFEDAKNTIDIYLSFEDVLRIVQDIKSSKIFKDMQSSQYPIQISFGGSVKDGKVEASQKRGGEDAYFIIPLNYNITTSLVCMHFCIDDNPCSS